MATIMAASSVIDVNQAVTMSCEPPRFWYHSRALPVMVRALPLTEPKIRPNASRATSHETKALRCRRQASPNGPRRRGDAWARPV